MNTDKMALYGGKKTRTKYFNPQPGPDNTPEYRQKILDVLEEKILSGYRGNGSTAFWGGKKVGVFESVFAHKYKTKNAIAMNSCTSALHSACAAIGLKPGDEVIVTPQSMSCSASIPLQFGAIPVFADVEPEYFCLDPDSVEQMITDKTKAIIAVDLFGQPYADDLSRISLDYNIPIIEDAAQAIGSKHGSLYAGTIGDIGCFSFTQGKHITAGEGGVAVTAIEKYAKRLAMFRNHAEAVANDNPGKYNQFDLAGLNLRMTEIQAAILLVELENIDSYILERRLRVMDFTDVLKPYFRIAPTRPNCTHTYYVAPFLKNDDFDVQHYAELLRAELMPDYVRIDRGVPVNAGYITPLYKMPLFTKKEHWAFHLKENKHLGQDYKKLYLKNAEEMQNNLLITLLHGLDLFVDDVHDIKEAILKVNKFFFGG
jgi:perosamine synthetase